MRKIEDEARIIFNSLMPLTQDTQIAKDCSIAMVNKILTICTSNKKVYWNGVKNELEKYETKFMYQFATPLI